MQGEVVLAIWTLPLVELMSHKVDLLGRDKGQSPSVAV